MRKIITNPHLPVAVLLEGVFPSAFRNRMVSNLTDDKNFKIKTESRKTKMIVIADADIIRNEVRRVGLEETPLPLGQDKYTGQMFGNRDFLINCLNYLVDDHGIMELRSRELKLRLLNKSKVKSEKIRMAADKCCWTGCDSYPGRIDYTIISEKEIYTRFDNV